MLGLVEYQAPSDAQELLAALTSLAFNSDRSELRAAGVPQHTIDRLYPVTFEDIARGLLEYIAADDLNHLADSREQQEWDVRAGDVSSMVRDSNPKTFGSSERADAYSEFKVSEAHQLLEDHIVEHLTVRLKAVRTNILIRSLWHAHWFMTHPLGVEERVEENFTEVMNWALPDLLRRTYARDTSQRDVPPLR